MELRNKVLKNGLFSQYSQVNISGWLTIPDTMLKNIIHIETNNMDLLNEFANSFESRRSSLGLMINTVYPLELTIARELIALLKKEYNLNN